MSAAAQPTGIEEFLLAFADDEHLMGQQHTEWIGVAPFLEEDLAFSSIGQDELGHALMLYELVLELRGVEPTDGSVDELAYFRGGEQYRSSTLVEYATTDWAEALVRHWLYDTIENLRWQLVAQSSFAPLAEVAARAQREESYHRQHARALLDPLLASQISRLRILTALDVMLPMAFASLSPPAGESEAIAEGLASGSVLDLAGPLTGAVTERFDTDVAAPETIVADRRVRSADFAPLMSRMREVFDLDHSAVW